MRFGYVSNGLADHRLADGLAMLADSGYDGIALTLDHHHLDPFADDWPARTAEVARLLAGYDLDCVVETGARFVLDGRRKHYPNLLTDNSERRIAFLERSIEIAAELGAPVVSMWSGAAPEGLAPQIANDRLLAGCERIINYADRFGVVLGFEPEPGMLVESIADFETLHAAFGHTPTLQMTLDIGHCVCLEPSSPGECIRRAAGTLAHVHVEDMRRGVHEHLMFGEGELDLPAALAALNDVGYEGMVAVELSRDSHRAHEVVPAAISVLQNAESQLARE